MRQKKKEYLSSYLLQETKINRLRKMADINPEMQLEYANSLNEALLLRMKIEKQISQVDGNVLSEVLFQKYIFGKTLEDIAAVLNYSTRHIERLHIKALDKFKM
jgi:DNA-directed RNA polymerase specialized sigma subunit